VTIRIAAIEVSHWHSVFDAAYLRLLERMPGVKLVGLQDPDAGIAAKRAAEVGSPPVFTDYRQMLRQAKPDFVIALGRHSAMAEKAHWLIDEGVPFLMEKPMGLNATEVHGIAEKADARGAFVALPLPMRYTLFVAQAKQMLAAGRFGTLSHLYVRMNRFSAVDRYPGWDCPWMLDPVASAGGCLRNLGTHGFDLFTLFTGEDAEVVGAQMSNRVERQRVEDYISVLMRSTSGVLGTLEIGTVYPRKTTEGRGPVSPRDRLLDGADSEWKLCGSDALLMAKDGALRIVHADGEETLPGEPPESPAGQVLKDTLAAWQAGRPAPAGVHDCLRAVRLIDQAYAMAGPL
jgi:predicted dehydrogenase